MSFYEIGKRIIDFIGAIVGIILFFPMMIVTAVHIKLVSPEGPVFADIPNRVGKGGKEFKMYKFRSMIPNAHKYLVEHKELYKRYVDNNYKLSPLEDPRIIKGGEFIRKTSIDELPQFFNVLQGKMSLVGPRAYYPYEVKEQKERFPDSVKNLDLAVSVKPGITGVWQTGGRSQVNFEERVKMDAEYAKSRSLLQDLVLLTKTPYVVLSKRGAV